jgi:hypothetical protein
VSRSSVEIKDTLPMGGSSVPTDRQSGRLAIWGMWTLIAYTVIRNILAASSRPFWFDELCTVAVAGQSTLRDVSHAAIASADSHPLGFYVTEWVFRRLFSNQEIAYRLPSIIAFACVLWCIFVFIRKRNSAACAFVCASCLLLTPLLRPYAIEARGYSLISACLAFALVCYQHAPKLRWMVLMGLAFFAAESWHFLSIYGFVPFAGAELAMFARSRKIRWPVWLALLAGFFPLFASARVLVNIKRFYGSNISDKPSLFATANAYSLMLKSFPPIAIAVVVTLSMVTLWTIANPTPGVSAAERNTDAVEHWLCFGFLMLPIVAFGAALVFHGAFEERYALPMVLGLPLSAAYIWRLVSRRGAVLVVTFIFIAVALQEASVWQSGIGTLIPPSASVERLVASAGHADLPVVISDGHDYLAVAHYARDPRRYLDVVDAQQVVTYIGTDAIDRQMPALKCCLPVQVYQFNEFASGHSRFLLYSGGGDWDWWATRLTRDGDSVELLAIDGARKVYLVNLK